MSAERHVVWVVDDSKLEAERTRDALTPRFHVEVFGDGPAVIERSADAELPDAVLLDWVMPEMTGLEVCRSLRERGVLIPVLMVTSESETDCKLGDGRAIRGTHSAEPAQDRHPDRGRYSGTLRLRPIARY